MSIIKEYGKYRPICDKCCDILPAQDSFDQAVAAMKNLKWKTAFEDGEYINACPVCKKGGR